MNTTRRTALQVRDSVFTTLAAKCLPTPKEFAARWVAASGNPAEERLRGIGECFAKSAGFDRRQSSIAIDLVIGAFIDIEIGEAV